MRRLTTDRDRFPRALTAPVMPQALRTGDVGGDERSVFFTRPMAGPFYCEPCSMGAGQYHMELTVAPPPANYLIAAISLHISLTLFFLAEKRRAPPSAFMLFPSLPTREFAVRDVSRI